jgi:hypothetical protein
MTIEAPELSVTVVVVDITLPPGAMGVDGPLWVTGAVDVVPPTVPTAAGVFVGGEVGV